MSYKKMNLRRNDIGGGAKVLALFQESNNCGTGQGAEYDLQLLKISNVVLIFCTLCVEKDLLL